MVNERQLVNFKIGREEFGIDIMKVQEIIRMTEITEIPGSPYYVEGVVNLRGEVLPVLDLRKRFGLEEKEKCDTNRIVVVNENKTITGIIVDSVSEVLQLHERDVEPPPRIVSGVDGDFIEGIGKLNGGERFIIMLDLRSVLNVRSGEKDFSADNADVAIESEPEAEPEPVIEEHTLEMPIPGQGIETAEFEEALVDAGSVEKSGIGGRTRKSKKAKA